MNRQSTPPPPQLNDAQEVALIRIKQYCRFPLHLEPKDLPKGLREHYVYVLLTTFDFTINQVAWFFHRYRTTIARDYEDAIWKKRHVKGYEKVLLNTRAQLLYMNSIHK